MAISIIDLQKPESELDIGEVKLWYGVAAPSGWLLCDGSVIERATYSDLFEVLGTVYGGGDGSTTYAIPNMKGRVVIGVGDSGATGHTNHTLGQVAGEETHTLSLNELASHNHYMTHVCTVASGNLYGAPAGGELQINQSKWSDNRGSSWAHNNMMPYVGANYIIYTNVE